MKALIKYTLLLLPFNTTAQKGKDVKSTPFVSAYAGVTGFDAGHTNTMLAAANMPKMKTSPLFSAGFSVYLALPKHFFTDLSFSSSKAKNEQNSVKLEQAQTNFDINVNYSVLNKNHHHFFPAFGFGWQTNSLKLISDPGNITFSQSLAGSGNEKLYTNKNIYYISLKLAYDYSLDGAGTILVGVRTGYRLGINKKGWEMSGHHLDNSPDMNANGYYVQAGLTVGLKGRSAPKESGQK